MQLYRSQSLDRFRVNGVGENKTWERRVQNDWQASALLNKVSSIVKYPRIVALLYHIEHESSVDYSKAKPVYHEEEGFRIRIEDGLVRFEMKADHPTAESAFEAVNPYIENWELDAALRSRPGEFKLKFVRPEIIDREPTPSVHRVSALPSFWKFTTSVSTVTVGRPYPKPPVGVSLKGNDEVTIMLHRYEDLCKGREKLPAVAQFCLTMLERIAGNRQKVARKFAIEKSVLARVGNLANNKGGPGFARKSDSVDQELMPEETIFLENAVKVFIRRAAEEIGAPCEPLRKITINDFPELCKGH